MDEVPEGPFPAVSSFLSSGSGQKITTPHRNKVKRRPINAVFIVSISKIDDKASYKP
jgi:hypothetical protein